MELLLLVALAVRERQAVSVVHLLLTLVAAAAVLAAALVDQVVLAVEGRVALLLLVLRVRPTQVVAAEAVQALVELLAVLAALALSLFDTPLHRPQPHLQLARQLLQLLVVTVFTNGLVLGVLHSDGTLCTN
jgi:hypothetical protein